MGGAWIRATDGPCEAYFYGRSLVEENCIGFVTGQYYKCEASFCSPCQEAGKAMLCLGVFGLISGMLTILVIVKRILKDLPQDWAGRNLKKLSIGISLFTAVLWFLAWLVFLGACESNLGDFGSSTPHTGFVLMFLAMCLAAVSMTFNIFTIIDKDEETMARQSSAQGMIGEDLDDGKVDPVDPVVHSQGLNSPGQGDLGDLEGDIEEEN
eukprot:CAMPEP_0184488698 /NCGR_PEP_ID=MMETSP0113_2-20130426/13091_1 /TAXON_ID=91329 /ORGANISM="Norrisiella sphaerica, Strain BC52" /LENGTH=209 /DNA_ID=CAMNT_0026871661 /DNA_START=383 /DNA_END=1012 /DNA_ORIENTATION=+